MLIEVTAEDIANGKPKNCGNCPVARAVIRAVETPRVRVGTHDIRIQGSSHLAMNGIWLLPPSVKVFIGHFDDPEYHSECEPFTFELTEKKWD